MSAFRYNLRIYYEDTDAGGIVYYANYLKFAERGRTEALREMGFDNNGLRQDEGIIIVVRKIDIDYLMPARLEDEVCVVTQVTEIKGSSFWMQQDVEGSAGMHSTLKALLVCIDAVEGRPKKIPDGLRAALEQHKMLVH